MAYQVRLREQSALTYNLKPFFIFVSIFPIFIGLILRLPKFILEINENKRWSIDWIKVATIGIPSLYIAMIPILYFSFGKNILFAKEFLLLGDTTFTSTAGIVFGYVLLDSLKKQPF